MSDLSARLDGLSHQKRAAILKLIRKKRGTAAQAIQAEIPLVPRLGPLPVSFAQQRLWFLDRLQPGSPAYNIPGFFRIEGRLDPGLLAQVLSELVRRHESLRTTFEAPGGEPLQRIHPPAPVPVPRVDLDGLPAAVRTGEARRLAQDENGRGFDLESGPLFRAILLRLGAEEHVLLVTVHHVVSDGWSTGIMAREVSVLYDAFRQGLPAPLPELAVQYADFAVWQRHRLAAETLESELAFWRGRLADLPAVLELPTDRPRPPVQGFRGAMTPIRLGPALSAALVAFSRREAATLFMTLLAAFQVLLGRFSGQELFGVGTPIAGRIWLEIEPLIGCFVNTLVLRADLSGEPGFQEVLRRVREEALAAQTHQELPFEKLVEGLAIERSLSHTPLFQVMFAFQNTPEERLELPGLALVPLGLENAAAKFDLGLTLGQDAAGLAGAFDYSTDLFDGTTIQRLAGHFQILLEALAADPGLGVWSVPLLGPAELHHLLVEWNDTRAPGEPLLHRLVEEQAARTPHAVAVEAGGVQLTYAGLVEQARRLAEGIDPGTIVALAAERTPELIVQMLAVLQAGAAYLPVDPAYPEERRAYMLADSGAHAAPGAAYILYTSGSTGRPKGVVVPHPAIASFVRTALATYDLAPGDRVLQLASISFDTSVEEIWATLAAGATLVLRPEEMVSSIPHFLREVERLGITVLDLPTAFWHEMVPVLDAEELELPPGVRLVVLGGEEVSADRLALWHACVDSSVRLINTYGLTETTIVATRRELSGLAPGATVPIGRPIPGARVYVLDRFFTPVPPGVRGEVWIGGTGVARGYLGRPDLTAERFRPNPFVDPTDRSDRSDRSDDFGSRLYRTGDLAVLKPDGDLVFAGRADRQLKIRGYRIEPGEIEAALRLHPDVRDAVVDAHGTGDARRLVAWVVPRDGCEAPGAMDLRDFLRGRLPEPLVPAAFVPVPVLPLTPNGKVDRRRLQALPAPSEELSGNEPRSTLERAIAEIYRDLLQVSRVGLSDNFFDLGGHSLLVVRAHQKLKETLGREVPVLDLFRFPTVAGLARHLEGDEETGQLQSAQEVQGLSGQERAARQRRWASMERRRRPDRTTGRE